MREVREGERAARKNVTGESRVGARARQRDVVAVRVLKMNFDAGELARVCGESGVAVLRLHVAEEEV